MCSGCRVLCRGVDDEVVQVGPGFRQATTIARSPIDVRLGWCLATLPDSSIPDHPHVGVSCEDTAEQLKRRELVPLYND
jgi:hypothetical protein